MVSSWCDHGTIKHYLREVNPDADRVNLVNQTPYTFCEHQNFNHPCSCFKWHQGCHIYTTSSQPSSTETSKG